MTEKRRLIIKIQKPNFKNISFKKLNRKRILRASLFVCLGFAVVGSGAAIGIYKALMHNLPDISQLEEFEPKIITTLFAENEEIIGEYAEEKRIEVKFEDMPEILIKSIIATEDPRFYSHKGIDYLGILRAIKADLKLIFTPRKLHGGSTITQQLIRELLLNRDQKLSRKIKEAILARKIERKYTKEEILAFYCNQFNLGSGAYGVEAASRLYFDKSVSELSLEEAALITGIFRGPSLYSPYNNPDLTLRRRNFVLGRLVDQNVISEEEAEEARRKPLGVLPRYRNVSEFAAYFKEEVRKYIVQNYGNDALLHSGLKVYSTLNPKMQGYAEEALVNQLRALDKRLGWRDDKENILDRGVENLDEIKISTFSSWLKPDLIPGKVVDAVVLSAENQKATVKVKDYLGIMDNLGFLDNKEIFPWTNAKYIKDLIQRGDVIKVKIKEVDEEKKEMLVSLDQEPVLEGAFLAIDPLTGQIKAMVGGYSFERLEFNQATQALRQSGSVIKPMLYTAAIENGWTPSSAVVDEPVEFPDKWADIPYSPRNYDRLYKGRVTLRMGIEQSRNVVTTKILDDISPQTGVRYCQKFGITSTIYPYLSLALGAFEVRLIEMVSAFTTFPNKGVRITPYFITRIEDKDGNVLEEHSIESEEVISPQVAYIMTSLLQGVVQRGTAQAARWLEKPLGGKTGTADDYSNAWFIGFSPTLCAGVWVGHEQGNMSIGERQTGAVAALPAWIEFFQNTIDDEKRTAQENGEEYVPGEFEAPPNLDYATIDYKTGLLWNPICLFPFREVYLPGTGPTRWCTYEDHLMTWDYYNTIK